MNTPFGRGAGDDLERAAPELEWSSPDHLEEGSKMEPCKVWIEQCEAARRIEDEFGVQDALAYLVGEKFLNFLEAAETHPDFRAEVPAFASEVRTIFEPWQLAEYLETARQTDSFDHDLDDED